MQHRTSGRFASASRICLRLLVVLIPAMSFAAGSDQVQVRMENVNFHVGHGVELRVLYLTGRLASISPGKIPTFDDVNSYVIEIDSARVSMTAASLTSLMNNVLFAAPDAPIKNASVEIEGTELKQTGTLKKGVSIPFTMRASLGVTSDGKLRLHPTSMKAAGIVPKGVLDFFGLHLDTLLKVKSESAMQVSGDDLLLDPARVLPPPRIRGKLTRAWIADGVVFEQFGGEKPSVSITPPIASRNFMYYRGGTLRFGKLTMVDTDLMLVDDDPSDPFDFSPADYKAQLVAGYSKNTPDNGLVTHMPDLSDITKRGAPKPAASSRATK
jgi:hypothetical protein